MKKIVIIGGGASGMAAAIIAAEKGADVTVLERNDRVLKKLLATGNGRCNLSHTEADDPNHYHGESAFVKAPLRQFGVEDTKAFFHRLGVLVREENKKLFPYSLQAAAVSDALRIRAEHLGVKLLTGQEVKKIETGPPFCVQTKDRTYHADAVIVTVGGKASPQLSGGNGYGLLSALGHTKTPLFPALVPLKADVPKSLAGTKTDAELTLMFQNQPIKKEAGELLFTEYGLSGPPVIQLSALLEKEEGYHIKVDLLPEFSKEALFSVLWERKKLPVSVEHYFTGFLKKTIGQQAVRDAALKFNTPSAQLTEPIIHQMVRDLKEKEYTISGTAGWQNAQVTRGGIVCREFSETMQSKRINGLYAAGEVLNIHGDCGGFNLQWAWTSGIIAASYAAEGQ